MSGHESESDPVVEAALANAPREMAPSVGFTDRTIDALEARGLVHTAPRRLRRSLIAAAWFIGGVGTGAFAMQLWRSASDTATSMIATNQADFVEWY